MDSKKGKKSAVKILFASTLRQALHARFGSNRVSARQFANAFNLRSMLQPVSDETARKWLNGQCLPRYERLFELVHWLEINPMNLFNVQHSSLKVKQDHDILRKKNANLTLADIKVLSSTSKKPKKPFFD